MSKGGGGPQQFSLKWNNYHSHMATAFEDFRADDDLTDVTLSAEGRRLKAHKIILSACSLFFKETFKENPCKHPIIILNGVTYQDLQAVIKFMYNGQVNVSQERLSTFLQTAELLEIKGLTNELNASKDILAAASTGNVPKRSTGSSKMNYNVVSQNSPFSQSLMEFDGSNGSSDSRTSVPTKAKKRRVVPSTSSIPSQSQGQVITGETALRESSPMTLPENSNSVHSGGEASPKDNSIQGNSNNANSSDPIVLNDEYLELDDEGGENNMFIPGTVLKFDDDDDEEFSKMEAEQSLDESDIKISNIESGAFASYMKNDGNYDSDKIGVDGTEEEVENISFYAEDWKGFTQDEDPLLIYESSDGDTKLSASSSPVLEMQDIKFKVEKTGNRKGNRGQSCRLITVPRKVSRSRNKSMNRRKSSLKSSALFGVDGSSRQNRPGDNPFVEGRISKDPARSPYACPFCPKRYKLASSLDSHVEVHMSKDNACTICGQIMSRKRDLKRHYIKVHRTEPEHSSG